MDRKKSAKKSSHPQSNTIREQARQARLDEFMTNSSLNSRSRSRTPVLSQTQAREEEFLKKIESLQNRRNKAIELKDTIENKYNILNSQHKKYKEKSKLKTIKILREQYQMMRQQKTALIPELGYYISESEFVQGCSIQRLKQKISSKKQTLEAVKSQQKKSKKQQQKVRLKGKINFINNELQDLDIKMKEKEKEVQTYKQRLRLGLKEKKCFYANEEWPIIKDSKDNERYLPLELLGKGGFGEVYKCFDLENFEEVAIKIIIKDDNLTESHAENMFKHVKRQIETQKNLKHPNICEIKEILQESSKRIIFVLQYCEGPQLSVYLRKYKCIEEREAKSIIQQIFFVLEYLNSLPNKVIHYDLKPSNIIFHHGKIKILDFGLCKNMELNATEIELTSMGVGTYWYLPPETFEDGLNDEKIISGKVDIWSTGVIFFELLYGQKPFGNGMSQKKILTKNLIIEEGRKLKFPEKNIKNYKVSEKVRQFIRKCLQFDPEERISPAEAANHDYFKL